MSEPICRGTLRSQSVSVPLHFHVKRNSGMPHSTSDEVIRQARERRKEQVAACAERAAEKISRLIKSKVKLTPQALAEVIAADFEELIR